MLKMEGDSIVIKFCLFSDGKRTYAKLGDKCIGRGIRKLEFIHNTAGVEADDKRSVEINLRIDISEFEFMDPEKFDRAVKWMQDLPDEKDPAFKIQYDELLKECK